MLSLIVAVGDDLAIGQNGTMPWHLPEDLKHFKEVTAGACLLMGRRTFESLPGVLPGRRHIILTQDPSFRKDHKRVRISHNLNEELQQAKACEEEVFVIGGGQVYRQALPLADRLYLTCVHAQFPQADTYFPAIDWAQWEETWRSCTMEEDGLSYEFINYRRKP